MGDIVGYIAVHERVEHAPSIMYGTLSKSADVSMKVMRRFRESIRLPSVGH